MILPKKFLYPRSGRVSSEPEGFRQNVRCRRTKKDLSIRQRKPADGFRTEKLTLSSVSRASSTLPGGQPFCACTSAAVTKPLPCRMTSACQRPLLLSCEADDHDQGRRQCHRPFRMGLKTLRGDVSASALYCSYMEMKSVRSEVNVRTLDCFRGEGRPCGVTSLSSASLL